MGLLRLVPPGARGDLESRLRSVFAQMAAEEPRILVGALPFDPQGEELLYQPASLRSARFTAPDAVAGAGPFDQKDMCEVPAAPEYAVMVSRALHMIGAPDQAPLRKVVLSRRVVLEHADRPDYDRLLSVLSADPDVTTYRVDLDPAGTGDDHLLMGATPELLVSRDGDRVVSEPLAGSLPRGRDPVQDRERAAALLASDKDRREHRITVEYILDLLAPLCSDLRTPGGMGLRSTMTMWHLGTRIEGTLKQDAPSAVALAAMLHPTPAVGGHPREAALEAIRELEPHDRGFYAGAVGHVDERGDGEWHVALRCAQVGGSRITLHAGAGIVEGSVPESEVHETAAKFRAMLRALGSQDAPRRAKAS
ncbi:isochorismate synthase MenF [Pelagerythrobacter sp.]|uniref:isochorismate synthase n=1 Tax=Pelagerythrobacter sp. TaxID=2800702 RepID=UPI0035B0EE5D